MANKRAYKKVKPPFPVCYLLGSKRSPEPNTEILIDEINVPLALNLIYFKFLICLTNIFNFKAFF